jgi:MoaA/NifB/PqqE/SkfB family radical SAM enzyme
VKLDEIGFYTMSEERAAHATHRTALQRCELVLSARCNFTCPYCRHVGGDDLPLTHAQRWVSLWAAQGCVAVRFSGGEPTLYAELPTLVAYARAHDIKYIAVSTNGSAPAALYATLIMAGANDFSVSLDVCCAEDGDKMGMRGRFDTVVDNIRWLAPRVYTTVGVVLTEDNLARANDTIKFASELGVADIRVIPAAQNGAALKGIQVDAALLKRHPILAYRVGNLQAGRPVRGIGPADSARCGLVLDDVAACGDHHYPCIIYMRERGKPIGRISPRMREDRAAWYAQHDTWADPICRENCLDVCVDYNRAHAGRQCTTCKSSGFPPAVGTTAVGETYLGCEFCTGQA